ncbi:BirA family transcriptional regulator, biotin operon repressor / biotin-[acetyl-CoA-carboxylase] ligase [Lentibacillus halodurans]|uniref:Bifunctional ligase/repressor BirA n=1 Tax=Lentibacillus halodurans TaxID=237679 RepID=A0A1I0VDT1_9BACI|nr:biotin--[acetyl-CoA-carboxylase] ligase [Lentibacillus halodurans]SFA74197.1 BirA family transcriptional regulator, biotin operon repressor / biotin-[acetyl-CoA-carboxylase] ligase [Lentibacillus halodurans]
MESTRYRLIELLESSNHEYVSGQFLSDKLHISRSAIWKHMKELEKDGYIIEGISRKGYRIVQSPDKVSGNTVHWGLKTNWLGKNIIHKTTAASTQQIAHQAARENAEHGTVIIADEQTEGKGRMERRWHSSKHKGIWMSIILRPSIPPAFAPQLTLLTATVLADVIAEQTTADPKIKWPNDLLINDKKAAGILTEMQAEQDQIQYIVAGIGMNVNQTDDDFPDTINDKATSIKLETGHDQQIVQLIQQILLYFERSYDMFVQNGFPNIKNKWESYGYRMGESIKIRINHNELKATCTGVAEDGALLVQTDREGTQKIYSGEIEWFH